MSNIGSNNMENTRTIYVPQALMIKRKGNPEQLAMDWKKYIKEFKTLLRATKVARHQRWQGHPNSQPSH